MMQSPTHRRLNIVLVTETWPPEINGVAHSIFQLVQGLAQRGHQITLIRPAQRHQVACEAVSDELLVRGFPIPRYPQLQGGVPAYGAVRQKLIDVQPDVVHIVTEGLLGLAALYAARSLNLPVSSGFHSPFHEFSRFFGLGYLLTPILSYLRFFHRRTQITCVPSQKTLDQLHARGFERLCVVGRGVDTTQFSPSYRDECLRQAWGATPQGTVVLYVGRLSPEKGIDLVIRGFQQLRLAQPMRDLRLVIVGDGPDRARLQKLAPDAIFTGMQTGCELSAHYASADVFCFASQVETFGNVVLEAMASGLPVIAFDDACAGQVITHHQHGWLAALADEDQLVQLMRQLLPQWRLMEMGKAARVRVAAMSWQQPVIALEQAMQKAIACSTVCAVQDQDARMMIKK
ncbi:glycosyltransferase family 1 protein [uncultured Acinetobacter sp.]|uniref:glycosyltransferase family 4 protein n=1 Tax=uncultured Acinetobacter sp. TaxID=165433 RepID=UPI0026270014|nr:glycosyltransferase family 1 protein [uncultured Acinetobacter sp.]